MKELPIVVTNEGGKLMTQAQGQAKVQVYAESETRFFLKVTEASIDFVPGDDGRAKELILHQGGMDLKAPRVK